MPTYRENPTDREQTVVEEARSEGGILVFKDKKTRIIIRGRGGAQRTQNSGVNIGRNAGVMMPWDDKPNNFVGDTSGRP